MTLIDFGLFTIGVITFAFTLMVFLRDRRSTINLIFGIFLLTVAIWPFAIAGFRLASDYQEVLFWDRIIYLVGILTPAVLVYFAYIFPENKKQSIWLKLIVHLVPAFLLILLFCTNSFIQGVEVEGGLKTVKLGLGYMLWVIYYFGFLTWAIFRMLIKYFKLTGLWKAQVGFVLFAICVPAVGAAPTNVILPALGNYQLIFLGPVFLLATNTIIVYAVLKHRLMDIRMLIARSVAFALLVFALFSGYIACFYFVATMLTRRTVRFEDLLISSLLALMVAMSFQPVRKFFEKITSKIIHKEGYDTQEVIYQLTKKMATQIELHDIVQGVLGLLKSKLHVTRLCVDLIDSAGNVRLTDSNPNDHHDFGLEDHEIARLESERELLVADEWKEGMIKSIMRSHRVEIFMPICEGETLVGYLILGEKSSGEAFYSQDLDLLGILGPEFSIALQNAQRFEQIKQFNNTLRERIERATDELRNANIKLLELDRLKDEFISIASHDLRTPASIVRNHLWVLSKNLNKLPEQYREDVMNASHANERTVSLVNDILDVSRMESGGIEVKTTEVEITKVLKEIEDGIAVRAKEKNITMKFAYKKNLLISGDRDRVSQIINNLVDNAVKYTKNGGKVTVSTKEIGKWVEITVADNGVGIKKENLPVLFTKFGRIETEIPQAADTKGTGLGLFIAKKLTDLLQGEIEVKSTFGKGSTFTVRLPGVK